MRQGSVVVFDGQSLNNRPFTGAFPALVMARHPRRAWLNCAIGGLSWTNLAVSVAARTRYACSPWERRIGVLTGGYSDILGGDSGATAHADMVAYAAAAGFTHTIACTMTHGVDTTGAEQGRIDAFNELVRGYGWDGVADFAASPILSDPSNATYFVDGLHWTAAGAEEAADILDPVLAPLLI